MQRETIVNTIAVQPVYHIVPVPIRHIQLLRDRMHRDIRRAIKHPSAIVRWGRRANPTHGLHLRGAGEDAPFGENHHEAGAVGAAFGDTIGVVIHLYSRGDRHTRNQQLDDQNIPTHMANPSQLR